MLVVYDIAMYASFGDAQQQPETYKKQRIGTASLNFNFVGR